MLLSVMKNIIDNQTQYCVLFLFFISKLNNLL